MGRYTITLDNNGDVYIEWRASDGVERESATLRAGGVAALTLRGMLADIAGGAR